MGAGVKGLSAGFVRTALSAHAAIGLLAGALIYILCVSGTVAVIHEEWQRWEQPAVPDTPDIAPEAVQRGAEAVLAAEAGRPATSHLWVHLPTEGLPRTVVTTDHGAAYLDGQGRIAAPEAHRWTEFVLDLHYYLHLPRIAGLTLVGGLGAMLVALAIGGVLAHPRIFRDAFRLRARAPDRVALADWHNRLGVWALPFTVAVALTGAVLGLATVAALGIAAALYDGDPETVFAPVFGADPAPDARPAPLADLAAGLRHMERAFPQVHPTYVILHDPGTAGQHLQILADHPRRLIFGEYYAFAPDGTFRGAEGMADGALGKQAAASTYKLHFGSFAGLPGKVAYILFGIALSVVSATGMSIWLAKRRRKGRASPRLEGFWAGIVWGTPALLAATAILRLAAGPDLPFAAIFWAGLALLAGAGATTARAAPLRSGLILASALLLPGLALVHLLATGAGPAWLAGIDGALLAGGLAFAIAFAGGRARPRQGGRPRLLRARPAQG